MIHLHIKHKDAFQVLRYSGVKSWCFDVMYVDRESWYVHCVYIQAKIFIAFVIWLVIMRTVFPLYRYLFLVCISVLFSLFFFLLFHLFSFLRFCGYIFCKPSRDLTYPLGGTKRFKGLLTCAKCNHDSYESLLGPRIVFLLFCSRTSKRYVWGYLIGSKLSHFTCIFHQILAHIII